MPEERAVEQHYRHGHLIEVIRERLHSLGRSPSAVSVDDLGPVDEFHIGGRQATAELAAQLELDSDDHVLDVGSGLGGTARFLSHNYGCRVTGIDLTQEYVEAAHPCRTGSGSASAWRSTTAPRCPCRSTTASSMPRPCCTSG
jgi:2-polyprenyl-3-methyl-5-hydroxy-6-metoxy-1,4-benzoquinol methylase